MMMMMTDRQIYRGDVAGMNSVTSQKPIVPKLLSNKWPETWKAVQEPDNFQKHLHISSSVADETNQFSFQLHWGKRLFALKKHDSKHAAFPPKGSHLFW